MPSSPIIDRVYVAQNVDQSRLPASVRCFRPSSAVSYQPYCDDFGPMNMSSVIDFVRILNDELASHPETKIVYCVDAGRRNLTNAVFLLGSYMILKDGLSPSEVAESFERLDSRLLVPYRDATYSKPDFELHLIDCWRGLSKGKELGWVRLTASSSMCGEIDMDQYRYYDDPNNGDLHEVVPGRFVAFKGPVDLGGRDFVDMDNGARAFSPRHYASILRELGVSTVVRLNEPRYSAKDFKSLGFEHADLEFDDCTCPPDAVVTAFLRIVDAAPGAVAVHCHAGLGRTGTLIALWLMRSHGFTAREAMGWLRIMRPGSVIGEQQQYLCDIDVVLCAARAARAAGADMAGLRKGGVAAGVFGMPRRRSEPVLSALAGSGGGGGNSGGDTAAALAEQVKAGTLRRSASYAGLGRLRNLSLAASARP